MFGSTFVNDSMHMDLSFVLGVNLPSHVVYMNRKKCLAIYQLIFQFLMTGIYFLK